MRRIASRFLSVPSPRERKSYRGLLLSSLACHQQINTPTMLYHDRLSYPILSRPFFSLLLVPVLYCFILPASFIMTDDTNHTKKNVSI